MRTVTSARQTLVARMEPKAQSKGWIKLFPVGCLARVMRKIKPAATGSGAVNRKNHQEQASHGASGIMIQFVAEQDEAKHREADDDRGPRRQNSRRNVGEGSKGDGEPDTGDKGHRHGRHDDLLSHIFRATVNLPRNDRIREEACGHAAAKDDERNEQERQNADLGDFFAVHRPR